LDRGLIALAAGFVPDGETDHIRTDAGTNRQRVCRASPGGRNGAPWLLAARHARAGRAPAPA